MTFIEFSIWFALYTSLFLMLGGLFGAGVMFVRTYDSRKEARNREKYGYDHNTR